MEEGYITRLRERFESVVRHDERGEYWYASDIARLMGLDTREGFGDMLDRAREACARSGSDPREHFREISEDVEVFPSGNTGLPDTRLSRYACFLIMRDYRRSIREEWREIVVYAFPLAE